MTDQPQQQDQIAQLQQFIQQLQGELGQARQQIQAQQQAQVQQQIQAQQQAQGAPQINQPATPQPVPPPNPIAIKPDKPANFLGRRNESVDSWLFQLHQYFALVPIPVERQPFFAATFFKENAALWWRSWVEAQHRDQDNNIHVTWDQFTAAVRAQFRPINAERIAREKLASLRQTTSVDITEMSEADRLFSYIRGLKKEIAALVQVSNPQSVAAAASTAENIDAVYWEHRSRPSSASRMSRQNEPMPMELDKVSIKNVQLTEEERRNLRRAGGCFYCRELGHLARECPRKKARINAVEEAQAEKECSQ
jgi:hypothetical protein